MKKVNQGAAAVLALLMGLWPVVSCAEEVSVILWNTSGRLKKEARYLKEWNPDLMFFTDSGTRKYLSQIAGERDFLLEKKGVLGRYGVVSRFPIADHEILKKDEYANRVMRSRIEIEGESLTVYMVKFPRVDETNAYRFQKHLSAQLGEARWILERVRSETGHRRTVILGDFNSLPQEEAGHETAVSVFAGAGYVDAVGVHLSSEERAVLSGPLAGGYMDYIFLSPDLAPGLRTAQILTATGKGVTERRAIMAHLDL